MIDNIGDLVHEYFGVLDSGYIDDQLRDMSRALEHALTAGYAERYVLIDGETGQLESRRLYPTKEEAEKAANEPQHGKNCLIAMLLYE